MKSNGANSGQMANLPGNLAELEHRCVRALDQNRNQRQALILLMHYALLLRQDAVIRRTSAIHEGLTRHSDSVQRIARSFVLLSRASAVLEQWRTPFNFENIVQKNTFPPGTIPAGQVHNKATQGG